MDSDHKMKAKRPDKKTENLKTSPGTAAVMPSIEESESFLATLKNEWSLFWHAIVGDDETPAAATPRPDPFETGHLRALTLDQIRHITRALSTDRKKLNQHIEQVQREIETNTHRLETVELVGGNPADAVEQINKLSDVGQELSLQLQRVDDQLRRFREREDALRADAI